MNQRNSPLVKIVAIASQKHVTVLKRIRRMVLGWPCCSPLLYFLYLIYLLYFLLFAHSFAQTKISTLLFSCNSTLFHKNTRGGGHCFPRALRVSRSTPSLSTRKNCN